MLIDMRHSFIFFLLVFLLFSGCLGFKDPSECAAGRRSERIQCYHIAAISQAYLGMPDEAIRSCYNIWDSGGAGYPDDDVTKMAETRRNNCILDVARITGNESVCGGIAKQTPDLRTKLGGSETTGRLCREAATKTAKLKPDAYYRSDEYKNSICNVMFVLPLLLGAVLFVRIPKYP